MCGHVRGGGGVNAAPHRGAQVGVHALCGMCAEKTKKKENEHEENEHEDNEFSVRSIGLGGQ